MHPTEEYAKSVVQHRQWIQNLGKPQIELTPRRRNENNLVTSSVRFLIFSRHFEPILIRFSFLQNLSSRSSPTVATDFAQEMIQITYQATRISREQPECVKLLRKALFDTVLAFDQKEYKCVADLFRDLADRAGKWFSRMIIDLFYWFFIDFFDWSFTFWINWYCCFTTIFSVFFLLKFPSKAEDFYRFLSEKFPYPPTLPTFFFT